MNTQKPYAATDVGIFRFYDGALQVYLVHLKGAPFAGRLAFPGALLTANETLKEGSNRVYREASGQEVLYLEQVYTFSEIDRDPRQRSISTAYMAFPRNFEVFDSCDKYAGGSWYNAMEKHGLAYDHDCILATCVERIAAKLNYTTIALMLLPEEFALSDMQLLYEVVLGKALDKRNFRKKIQSLEIVVASGQMRRGLKARPAMLYRAVSKTVETIPLFK